MCTVYTVECVSVPGAPLPPWCVSRLVEVLCDEQEQEQEQDVVEGTFRTLGVSKQLNAAMTVVKEAEQAAAAAANADGGGGEETTSGIQPPSSDNENAPDSSTRVGGVKKGSGSEGSRAPAALPYASVYYTERERQRVASAVTLNHRGIERVRRTGGLYYVQTTSFPS